MNKDSHNGRRDLISCIYSDNIQALYSYGRKFTCDCNKIKDAIHDVFLCLINNSDKLPDINNIKVYLFVALKRRLIKLMKKNALSDEFCEEDLDLNIVYSVEVELINNEENLEKVKMILDILSRITPKQREILYYRYTCNFDYTQICSLMSIDYDYARKIVYRALQSLRRYLNEAYPGQKLLRSLNSSAN